MSAPSDVHSQRHHQDSTLGTVGRFALFTLLSAYTLFAHIGCHNDEDNELFATIAEFFRF